MTNYKELIEHCEWWYKETGAPTYKRAADALCELDKALDACQLENEEYDGANYMQAGRIAELEALVKKHDDNTDSVNKYIEEMESQIAGDAHLIYEQEQHIAELKLVVQNYRLGSRWKGSEIDELIAENDRLRGALKWIRENVKVSADRALSEKDDE
jgi:hypothetical protein